MLKLGVTRFGVNQGAAVAILRECRGFPGGGVELPGPDRLRGAA
jgi:hypothetical protein